MNWDAVGAIAELLGSAAVFLTLVYLAIQVRHTRTDVRRTVRQSRAEVARERLRTRATDERLNELMVRAQESFGDEIQAYPFLVALIDKTGFSAAEAWSVFAELNGEWQYRVQVISNIDDLSAGERLEFDNTLRGLYGRRELTKTWYELHGRNLNPEAVAYVERILDRL